MESVCAVSVWVQQLLSVPVLSHAPPGSYGTSDDAGLRVGDYSALIRAVLAFLDPVLADEDEEVLGCSYTCTYRSDLCVQICGAGLDSRGCKGARRCVNLQVRGGRTPQHNQAVVARHGQHTTHVRFLMAGGMLVCTQTKGVACGGPQLLDGPAESRRAHHTVPAPRLGGGGHGTNRQGECTQAYRQPLMSGHCYSLSWLGEVVALAWAWCD